MKEVKVWGIHAGALGEVDSKFLSKAKPCIAIGWANVGDLSKISSDREDFKERLAKAYPDTKKGAVPTSAGMLFRFVHEIQTGDIVVYPSKRDKMVHIGKVAGNYEFNISYDSNYPNIRPVEWLKHVPRTKFSQGALYEIGSALSLFQVKNYSDEFIAVLSGDGPNKVEVEDNTVAKVAEEIEQSTRDFIAKKLTQELKGHPFEHFVAHILNILGYKTRVSPEGADGGIDIIAHKDELGIEPPIIKVQVKSNDASITPDKVQALYGNVSSGEYGLFVALNDFSKKAVEFAKSKSNLRIIDGEELVDIVLQYYEKIDSKYKAIIPLKNVYIPVQVENEE
ncbi:MAG: restriction endonuclease [Clostridia bacterium]|nr:restriction endonuclease [Clostridia bacterium]